MSISARLFWFAEGTHIPIKQLLHFPHLAQLGIQTALHHQTYFQLVLTWNTSFITVSTITLIYSFCVWNLFKKVVMIVLSFYFIIT